MAGQDDQSPAPPTWCDADLERAIAAAQESGLDCYRVEIAPDGTISIIVGDKAPDDGDAGAGDEPARP